MLRKIIYLFGLFTMFSGFISSGNAEEVNTYLSDGLIILADNHGGETAAPMVEEPVVAAEEVPTIDSGDTAWMITATLLVIMMSIPGLALFYGGLVRAKNMLSVLMQVFVTVSLMSILWAVYGYSLAATEGPLNAPWV